MKCVEKIKTHIFINGFSENRIVYEIIWKNIMFIHTLSVSYLIILLIPSKNRDEYDTI